MLTSIASKALCKVRQERDVWHSGPKKKRAGKTDFDGFLILGNIFA
jgi:hypothetical protein